MNPYKKLPENAFWKTAVANKNMFDISELWKPKLILKPQHKIATFGSCFAQHIGKALKERGFSWISTEPAPLGLSPESCKAFNYDIFSCRTGNIYTTSLLRQWTEWALDVKVSPDEYWEKEGRFYDPFRPNIEPNGFESEEEMRLSRQQAIRSFRQAIEQAKVFVFTLGLTESWFNKMYGYEYPMCPGTAAGEYMEMTHVFRNQDFNFILSNLKQAIDMMAGVNNEIQFILTVSPVPLTATNSGNHVLVATMESKSILRAVAGQVTKYHKCIDYFPSYEIISSPAFKGIFFEPNQRSVGRSGVSFVMNSFFAAMGYGSRDVKENNEVKNGSEQYGNKAFKKANDDVVCEEELLAAFGRGK